jgi:thiol-disulfide isomerase/thioredoxin
VAPGLIVSACALVVATGFGLLWQRRNGRVSAVAEEIGIGQLGAVSAGPTATPLTQDDLRAALGDRATLVQFSSAFCAPCRATRQILTEVAGMVDGVAHVEIDAESRLDLVRRLDVRRTPTTIVLDPGGQVTHRASGQPRKADVIAALGAVL